MCRQRGRQQTRSLSESTSGRSTAASTRRWRHCSSTMASYLWMPEAGGRVDYASEHDEHAMTVLGLSSKREVARTSIRVRTAMAVQVREQGRYLGGRLPYGYRLGDAGPHPNKAHAAWGRRARRLEPDPETAHFVRWIFAQRLAVHSAARIARALNEAGVPCPSASDPGRNPHRTGAGRRWARSPRSCGIRGMRAVRCGTGSGPTATWSTRVISPWDIGRCSGGTCRTGGSSPVSWRTRRWSARPLHRRPGHPRRPRPVARGDLAGPGKRRYLLAGLLTCAMCGRRTAGPPTGAAMAIPPPRHPTRTSPRTPMSARTSSCRTCPPSTCCSPSPPGESAAGGMACRATGTV
jgi:site-specific DNA recombinase